MEQFIREIRRGTKVRDHKFPHEEAVYKLLYLESERQEGRWAERRLKGFSKAREVLEKMLQEQYAPVHKRLHINVDTALAPNSHWLTNSRRVKAKTRNAVPAARTCTACSRPDSRKDSRRIPRRPVTCDRPSSRFGVLVPFLW